MTEALAARLARDLAEWRAAGSPRGPFHPRWDVALGCVPPEWLCEVHGCVTSSGAYGWPTCPECAGYACERVVPSCHPDGAPNLPELDPWGTP